MGGASAPDRRRALFQQSLWRGVVPAVRHCGGGVSLLLAAVAVGGCATHASLAVFSQPEGAYITEKGTGRVIGVTPTRVVYDPESLTKYRRADGCYIVKGLEARWVSGATSALDLISLCGQRNGAYNITFSRAGNYPDLEKDLEFALRLQSVRAQEQQAQASQDAALAAVYQAFIPKPAKPLNCTSTQIGNTVRTNCF
jgi:hypothetical protein